MLYEEGQGDVVLVGLSGRGEIDEEKEGEEGFEDIHDM